MSGWISLNRKICDHWLWEDKPFSKAQAWVDLLLKANHKDAKIIIKGQLIELKRGDQARSQVTLSKEWGWSRDKVKRFLTLLESDEMIRQQTSQLTSIISICNYSDYQCGDTAGKSAEKQVTSQQAGSKQVTNNNVNNENTENTPYQLIVDLYHLKCNKLPAISKLTDKRKKAIRVFWNKDKRYQEIDFYENYFSHVNQNPFLTGDNDRNWRADIDWLINETNMVKVQEGKY